MKLRYYVDEDDRFRRFVRPWIITIVAATLLVFGIKALCDLNYQNSQEYKRKAEIESSLSKAPEEGDNRQNIPDDQIGNYHYNGEEIIDYPGEIFLVKKVINGDTIVVAFQGEDVIVKFIGTKIPSCYAETAKTKTEEVLLGRRIKLVFDDKYGKTTKDGFVAATIVLDTFDYSGSMLLNGNAMLDDSVDFSNKDHYAENEAIAQYRGDGLWSVCKDSKETNRI